MLAASAANLVVAVWLVGSPFFVFFDPDVDEYWNPVTCGVLVGALSLARLLSGAVWPAYLNALVGLWLFGTAFWLSDTNQASWSNALGGAVVMLLALLSVSAGRDRTPHPNHQRGAQSSGRVRSQPARSDGGLDDPATYAGAALLGGGLGGLIGGATMTALLVLGAALAESQTAVAGVHQTGWTPLNATTAWVFELDPFTSGYRMASVVGAAIQLTVAIALGAAGMAAVALVLGRRPAIPAALALGLVYSALLYGVGLHVIVDAARDPDLVASAAPRWSWWAGSAVYGVLVAAFGAAALRRTSDLVSGRR